MTTDPLLPPLPAANSTEPSPAGPSSVRRPYETPAVQPLGAWSAVTLLMSLPIGPGGAIYGGPPLNH